ncbi:multimerin-2 isoform X2 [Austrofundulus limnaeus]|uniref:Multimerin-2 isoform X2 n=1 Tax=Austrofundulus limnaeus TaxID=52670 RepID=A0A2I4C6S5_AUSLI|nr:PREDICTED: multimerin-2 isoform X2 [Austrofundulus limnaeus]
MTAVGQLTLVLGLLVSAHCDVRARDPEVVEEGGVIETPMMRGTGKSPALIRPEPAHKCVSDGQSTPGDVPAGPQLQQEQGKPNQDQNDYQAFFSTQYEPNDQQNPTQPDLDPAETHTYHRHQHHQHQAPEDQLHRQRSPDHVASSFPNIPPVLPAPDMMALVMSQLQPILEGFNHSLEYLSKQMEVLVQDVEELKSSQPRREQKERSEEDKLEKVFQQIGKAQRQMEDQCRNMENMLHSQHTQLHQNLSRFKMNVNLKLEHHQKLLQVSLQTMNTTLTELKLDQDQFPDQKLEDELPSTALLHPDPPDTGALWEAITHLDNMVVNNTMKVGSLMEDVESTSGAIEQLTQQLIVLEKQINQTARTSQVLFMETGLEVEQAKVVVQQRVEELAVNVTQHEQRLQEMDVDVDYLYTVLYRQNSSSDCMVLKAAIARLERGMANMTELANENRLALEETEGGGAEWVKTNDWEPVVEKLQHSLQQVEETLVLERSRTMNLDLGMIQLNSSVLALQERNTQQEVQLKLLSASFRSLLDDAIRHNEVLQLLLGEEVLEFLEWTHENQEAHSLPVLKEQIRELMKQLSLPSGTGDREDVPSADQPYHSSFSSLPSDWPPGGPRRSSGGGPFGQNQQLFLYPEIMQHAGDGSDLWNLEKKVEKMQHRVIQLEENVCFCNSIPADKEAPHSGAKVQLLQEVTLMKRQLEEHLSVFKNVFSNTDLLAGTRRTLELDKLWELMKKKDNKKGVKGQRKSRSRSKEPGVFDQIVGSLLFVGESPRRVSNGAILFQSSLNQGQFYSDSGTFIAPVDGIYLFTLTLDLRPGPTHVLLRWAEDGGEAFMSLQQQEVTEAGLVSSMSFLLLREREMMRLEVRKGEWAESKYNMLFVLLLQRTA